MSLSAVFRYMAKQAVNIRNMVVTVKGCVMAHPHHCLVTQTLHYSNIIFNVLSACFITGPDVWSHYAANRRMAINQLSYCQAAVTYLQFPIQVCFPCNDIAQPATQRVSTTPTTPNQRHRHRHRHIPELTCGFNSSIDK